MAADIVSRDHKATFRIEGSSSLCRDLSSVIDIIFENPKKRCSIMWCPFKGKYSFGMEGYYECWFHGGDFHLETLWSFLTRPAKFLYNRIRYAIN